MGWHEDSVFAVSIGRDLEDRALADIGLAEDEADASHFAAGRGYRSELEGERSSGRSAERTGTAPGSVGEIQR